MFTWENGLVRRGLYYEGYVSGEKLNEVLDLHGRKTCTTYGTRTSVRSSRSRFKQPGVASNSEAITDSKSNGTEKENDNPTLASCNESKVFIKIFIRLSLVIIINFIIA